MGLTSQEILPAVNPAVNFEFFGMPISLEAAPSFNVPFDKTLSQESVQDFYEQLNSSRYSGVTDNLINYKQRYKLDDWLFYQLIRKTAQQFSPKQDNYHRYTLYKWFLLGKTGYNTLLTIADNKVLFYVQCDELVYNIPYRMKDGQQFVCLNYHDYGNNIDFTKSHFTEVAVLIPEALHSFTYKISNLPEFSDQEYTEKELDFNYYQEEYRFRIKVNPDVKTIFTNYPVVDYSTYFNIPLSSETYRTLIPELKKALKNKPTKEGVDFLMRFTRYAFLFKPDAEVFGAEKRLSPEQTLLFNESDCDDRAGLFFFLVKEIYDLPMIVLSYPKHVTIAVQFDKPFGNTIVYNGKKYSICEPTPQRTDLPIGKSLPQLRNEPYEVAYEYIPSKSYK